MTNEFNQPKRNYWKWIAIISVIIILGILVYFGYTYTVNKSLSTGYSAGVQYGASSIIQQINSQGKIPVLINSTGNITINWMDIKAICGGIK
jgi:predicted negative regulator of RcsB-dependent stress response